MGQLTMPKTSFLFMVNPTEVQTKIFGHNCIIKHLYGFNFTNQPSGFLWTKFMVPSIGSIIQVGWLVNDSTIPVGDFEMSSSPTNRWSENNSDNPLIKCFSTAKSVSVNTLDALPSVQFSSLRTTVAVLNVRNLLVLISIRM